VDSSVLELMAPLPPDSEVEGGSIIRDADGEPTGMLAGTSLAQYLMNHARYIRRQRDDTHSAAPMGPRAIR
jgi:predicted amidohydrolase YtcJ